MYQYFFNLQDEEAKKLLAQLTFITQDEFRAVLNEAAQQPALRLVQLELAKRIITTLHGEEKFQKAEKIAAKLFAKKGTTVDAPVELPTIQNTGERLMDILVQGGHVQSNREYREFIAAEAIKIDGHAITSENYIVEKESVILSIGKKRRFALVK